MANFGGQKFQIFHLVRPLERISFFRDYYVVLGVLKVADLFWQILDDWTNQVRVIIYDSSFLHLPPSML